MADDNHARYRSSDPFGRGLGTAGQTNDPLAELARLIGQNDPFADLEREARAAREQAASDHADLRHTGSDEPPPSHASEPEPQYLGDSRPHYDSDPASRVAGEVSPHDPDNRQSPLDWSRGRDAIGASPFSLLSQPSLPAAPSYESQDHPDWRGPSVTDSDHVTGPASDEPAHQPRLDRPAFLQALYPPEPEPEQGYTQPPQHDEFYDDVPRAGRRKGLLTVAAVLALAVVGTAGAFGYRSYFGSASSSAPPPVIRASSEPSKVAPPAQPVDQTASKFSYDRFGDRGQNEKVVLREEKPVDNRELGRSSMPRTALPGTPSASAAASAPSAPAAQSTSNPPSALGEPRRVRTVPIRPDGPDAGAPLQTPGARQAAPMQISPAPPLHRQPVPVAEAPANSRAEVSLPPPDARPAPARSNPRLAARSVETSDNAPLSLSPNANHAPPPMAAREAPPPRPAPPARVASAPAAGNGGGYLVQVSSQRSEADAKARIARFNPSIRAC